MPRHSVSPWQRSAPWPSRCPSPSTTTSPCRPPAPSRCRCWQWCRPWPSSESSETRKPMNDMRPIVSLNDDKTRQLGKLIEKSYESYMDLNTILPWEQGVNRSIAPKREDHSWIYGTEYWDALTPEQRLELLWIENAQTPAAFIWLEE